MTATDVDGGIVDALELQIDGGLVIDGSGNWLGQGSSVPCSGCVTSSDISNDTITGADIANDAIGRLEMQDDAVGTRSPVAGIAGFKTVGEDRRDRGDKERHRARTTQVHHGGPIGRD